MSIVGLFKLGQVQVQAPKDPQNSNLNKRGRVEDGVAGFGDFCLLGDDDAARTLAAVQAGASRRARVVVVHDVRVFESSVELGGDFSQVVEGVRLGQEDAVLTGGDEAFDGLVVDGQAQKLQKPRTKSTIHYMPKLLRT